MFKVILASTNEIVVNDIESGKEAEEIAKRLTEETSYKHQPRRIGKPDLNWRAREQDRFDSGEYIKVPWHTERWASIHKDHFVHVAKGDPGKLAFTEDEAHGEDNRKTIQRPGRYLRNYYGDHLSIDAIENWSRDFARKYEPSELQFAITEEDIERVYTNGPASCMTKSRTSYSCPGHPVRVYAHSDLAVAYLANVTKDNRVSARALCFPEKKVYGRIYGDDVRLCVALEREGFKRGDFTGAKLKRIPHKTDKKRFVAPFLDGINSLVDDGKNLIIDPNGQIIFGGTDGYSNIVHVCNNCDAPVAPNSLIRIYDRDVSWCEKCIKKHAFRCAYDDNYYTGKPIIMANGDKWSVASFNKYGFTCDATRNNYPKSAMIRLADGSTWAREFFKRNGYHCYECNQNYSCEAKCTCPVTEFINAPHPIGSIVIITSQTTEYEKATVVAFDETTQTYSLKKEGALVNKVAFNNVICRATQEKDQYEPGEWIYVGGESYSRWLKDDQLPLAPSRVQIHTSVNGDDHMKYKVRHPNGRLLWVYDKDILGKVNTRKVAVQATT